MQLKNSFLGRGWSFPPSFNLDSGEVNMVEDVEDINQSLAIIFSTSLGERVMQPEFGCNLSDLQFEPMNASMLGLLRDIIENAIIYHEPRITLENLDITESDSLEAIRGILKISIDYKISKTNSRFNFVYDFYLKEGNQLLP